MSNYDFPRREQNEKTSCRQLIEKGFVEDTNRRKSKNRPQMFTERKVLIVDDQIFNIKALKILLEVLKLKDDIQVCEAMNGLEALRAVTDDINSHDGLFCSF